MSHELVLASVDRAGDHAAVLGVMVLVAAAAALVYGLVRLAVKRRAHSARGPETERGPDA